MSEDLYTILDNCLTMLDQGSDLESCLARYPEYAEELRPLLLASMDAKSLSNLVVPSEVSRRNKSKILNAAAEMREQRSRRKPHPIFPARRIFRVSLAILLTLLVMVGIGGTSLVRASSVALPGDQFYPVKLTWETILLKMTVSQAGREALEDRFEKERVEEIEGLISNNRSEKVKLYGRVAGIFPGQIVVSGITVAITPDTHVEGDVQMQALVRVEGRTTLNGVVLADKIKVESRPSDKINQGGQDEGKNQSNDDSGKEGGVSDEGDSSSTPAPGDDQEITPGTGEDSEKDSNNSGPGKDQSTPKPQSFEIEGVVTGYNGGVIVVDGRSILIIPETRVRGNPAAGTQVSIRGFINEQGALVALRIEVKSDSNSGGSGNGGEGGGSSGGSDDDHDPTKIPKPEDPPDD
jgi:hypothetical protein